MEFTLKILIRQENARSQFPLNDEEEDVGLQFETLSPTSIFCNVFSDGVASA